MQAKQKEGKIHIYAGDGKGKTTCSVGLAVRAASRGWRVLFVQFLKSGKSAELKTLRSLPTVEVVSGMNNPKFTFMMTDEEKAETKKEMTERFLSATEKAKRGEIDMLVFDEALGCIAAGMLDEDLMLDFMKNKPESLELVLTGRDPSEALIEATDYYSEICMRKHPYETEGLAARPGVEF